MSNTTIMINSVKPMSLLKKLFSSLALSVILLTANAAVAGDEWSEEHIKREISYLAKQLLDMSGKESVSVTSSGYTKPFIGICTEISQRGLKITCVTPGTQAQKSGLQTGDMVVKLNGLNLQNKDESRTKKNYFGTVEKMKTGDTIEFILDRDGKRMTLAVQVGSLSHPAYELTVTR